MSRKRNSPPHSSSFTHVTRLKECPLCQTMYHPDACQLVREEHGERLIHITCHACSVAILARAQSSSVGVSVIGVVTDLSVHDAARVHGRVPVGEDDVLTLHTLLRQDAYFESLMVAFNKQ